MAGLVFLLVFWVRWRALAKGTAWAICIVQFIIIITAVRWRSPSPCATATRLGRLKKRQTHVHPRLALGSSTAADPNAFLVDEDGVPRVIDVETVRLKLRSIAKQKLPGLTGNGPDLYAAQPGSWGSYCSTSSSTHR